MNNNPMVLCVYRGMPGSGKTTQANQNKDVGHRVAADDWPGWYCDGKYDYDQKKQPKAHRWCLQQVTAKLDARIPVAVHNTNM